jgi:glyoxylase-like metal-dependent hydrolase (beta-lactamase superfamily II)
VSKETHRFKVGTFECIVVRDGSFAYPHPAQMLFVNASRERLEQVLGEHGLDPRQWEEYVSPYPSLMVNTGRHRVLVDTGAGEMAPTTGRLIPNLLAEGIAPEEIDTIILTHGHPDHIGGNTDAEGRVAFPSARYVMWKKEWEFWTSEPDLSAMEVDEQIKQLLLTFAHKKLPPIRNQLQLIETEMEIVPGIKVLAAPGHTPGHIAVAVSSEGQQLLCTSDAAIHLIHLEQPQWYSVFDLAPEQALASKRRLLERAVAERALVHTFHFPFPGLGHVTRKRDGWHWRALQMCTN